MCIRDRGYTVRCAERFDDVLSEFAAFDPHLVLLDVSLPFFNGYHWCQAVSYTHLIDKEEGGDVIPLQQPPEGAGVGLDPVGAADDQNGTVQHLKRPLDVYKRQAPGCTGRWKGACPAG